MKNLGEGYSSYRGMIRNSKAGLIPDLSEMHCVSVSSFSTGHPVHIDYPTEDYSQYWVPVSKQNNE